MIFSGTARHRYRSQEERDRLEAVTISISTKTSRRHHVRITVSVFAERNGKFLFIREMRRGQLRMSEPVGHLEPNESILRGAVREFAEETGYTIRIKNLLRVYLNHYASKSVSDSFRFAYRGVITGVARSGKKEQQIRIFWVEKKDLAKLVSKLSHPTSRRALRDMLSGASAPLSVVQDLRF